MGTTAVAALFSMDSSQVHIAYAGDSRCYRFRGGHLEQLTQDHSVLRDIIEQRPDLADDLLARLPKHAVTRALGMDPKLRVSIASHEVVDGDRFLLCSDGLSSPVPASAIAQALERQESPAQIVSALIDLTKSAGAPDNVAALVIDCRGPRTSELPITVGPDLRPAQASEPEILLLGIEELRLDEIGAEDMEELSKKLDSLLKR
jgi:protein phosphatase